MSVHWTTDDVVRATKGRLVHGLGRAESAAVATDTRTLRRRDAFLALSGERFDGHDFLEKSVAAGASILIVSETYCAAHTTAKGLFQVGETLLPLDVDVVVAPDTLVAYGDLARWHRRRLGIPLIAVTGSVGKSSTRRQIADVMAQDFNTCETQKNENNLVGVPKTILSATSEHRAIVVELGIDRPGEMAALLRAAEPRVGVMVGITYVHLDRLGSLDGVAREKARLLDAVHNDGWAVLNVDTPLASYFATRCRQVLTYGLEHSAAVSGLIVDQDERGCPRGEIIVRGRSYSIQLKVPGRHQFQNALAAWAVGELFEIAPEKRIRALENYEGFAGRFCIRTAPCGARIVDDTYNANPASFRAALGTLDELPASRRIVVAGDMFELGDISQRLHQALGEEMAKRRIERLVTVGPRSRHTAQGALAAGMHEDAVITCATTAEAVDVLRSDLRAGDLVLVKGSRGMTMEEIVRGLIPEGAEETRD